jgi:uncharacterized protein (TIGR02301 family)
MRRTATNGRELSTRGRSVAARLFVGVIVAALAVSPIAARAQETAPYDDHLMRLAEILGALHHLRPLCGASDEAQTWRDQMTALVEAEQPSPERARSEERRVGKECRRLCRSRWSPYH